MKQLWSTSTTMRNPERVYEFLSTIAEMEGKEWTKESQIELQVRLIKNRYYTPTNKGKDGECVLNPNLKSKFDDLSHILTYAEAKEIFDLNNYCDPAMRGRTSFDPVEKMGLVCLKNNTIRITETGEKFLKDEIELGDVMLSYLLKFQYPNPLMRGFDGYDTKPFINTLRLIFKVNEICLEKNIKAKGISKLEFGIFALSIVDWKDVDKIAKDLLDFRFEHSRIGDKESKRIFEEEYIRNYLSDFNNPLKNIKEYTDNIVRCLRLTKYIYIHGGGYYIDLEPRRMVEIKSIIESDKGSAKEMDEDEYINYIGRYNSYTLPFETYNKLIEIRNNIISDIKNLKSKLNKADEEYEDHKDIEQIKKDIDGLRGERLKLQNECLKMDYYGEEQINNAKEALSNINKLDMKPSVALEKWVNIALNIINDSILIKPNAPLGDDNEPTFTAPSKVPDIECYYKKFQSICEVTMLTGRDQWFNEGQPVMRHLRDFEEKNNSLPSYCIFIAPRIHRDTINTFWAAVKYEYEGSKQRIIPITINDLLVILDSIKVLHSKKVAFTNENFKNLLDECIGIVNLKSSDDWRGHISNKIYNFYQNAIAV